MSRRECKDIEWFIIRNLNLSRSKAGLRPLRMNWGLRKIARKHSGRMADSGRIWHGHGVFQAKSSISFNSFWDFIISLFYMGMSGENVGLMYSGRVKGFKRLLRTRRDIAFAQHLSWMRSKGHKQNILNSSFRLVGVGVVKMGNRYYCTELFFG